MKGLYFLLPTLLVILISFLIVRTAAIILMMTGMEKKKALFQALSAFTGTGFTTKEAEMAMNHPMRRRVVSWLMILGNAGIVTVIITTTSSFIFTKSYILPINILILLTGIFLIIFVAGRKSIIRNWERFIEKKFIKYSFLEEGITEDLLHLLEGYGLVKVIISEGSSFKGKTISSLNFNTKKILVLGIERGKHWLSIPGKEEKVKEGDRLIVYGPLEALRKISHDS